MVKNYWEYMYPVNEVVEQRNGNEVASDIMERAGLKFGE